MYHSFQYATVREALKEHFYYQYQKGLVQWPKKFKDIQKETFPLTRAAIINRVNIEYERVLYIQSSTLRSQDRRSGLFYLLIGDGLFSNIDYNAGDHIADYVGELISAVEALRREEAGRGGYTIYIQLQIVWLFLMLKWFRVHQVYHVSDYKQARRYPSIQR